ncbi:hypothetical protein PN441_16360 [Spirulina major CS-329]|jgi:hypothetical protein|uniref:hypothetical protein n=1 Tax=Spirulina TaxID=1154 RepID=UPI00232E4C21|nr:MULTISPECIES: hypothetical protein [Spirulina]MDB9495841.1 hypothetical protein [Spirulina subsalsa CS-330]MDB9504653.1 hypothetical protein [Spirulina major CS-329]
MTNKPRFKYQLEQQKQAQSQAAPAAKPRPEKGGPLKLANPKTPPAPPPPEDSKSGYQAAVPITVYRQLADELQTLKAQLHHLQGENQHLHQQNQMMGQALQQIAGSLQPFQTLAAPPEPAYAPEPTYAPEPGAEADPSALDAVMPPFFEADPALDDPVATIAEPMRRSRSGQASAEMSGWLLWVAVILMIATALGGGFIFVRSLLSNPTQN